MVEEVNRIVNTLAAETGSQIDSLHRYIVDVDNESTNYYLCQPLLTLDGSKAHEAGFTSQICAE